MSTRSTSIFLDPNVAKHLSLLDDKYVIVSSDKAPNNIVFVCKSHYIDCLIKEVGIYNSLGNPTYTPTTHTKEEILDNHRSILCSFQTTLYCWVCQILNETSFQIISMYSIGGNSTVTLATREVVCIRCGL
jgi:hypothetical protein